MKDINIRLNCQINGYFYSNNKKAYVGKLVIKNGRIILYIVGSEELLNNNGQIINSSNDGVICGKLSDGIHFQSRNFALNGFQMNFKGIPSISYKIYSFVEFSKSNINHDNYGKVILNIDKLSKYLYLPQIFNNKIPGYVLGDVKYKGHIYTISLNFNSDPERYLNKMRDVNQRWINLVIQAHFDEWYRDKYMIPLSEEITKFIRIMTRLRINITNVKKFIHSHIYFFVSESRTYKRLTYYAPFHHLSYLYNRNNFRAILNRFLNRTTNLNALVTSILTSMSTNYLPIQTNLINLTDGIQIYYSNFEKNIGHSLWNKIDYLILMTPIKICSLILRSLPGEKLADNIRITRNHIVHGSHEDDHYGHLLTDVELPIQVNMLKWLIYSRILLDIGVPPENIYDELTLCTKTNHKRNYIRRHL